MKQKKIITLEEYLKEVPVDKKTIYAKKYEKSISDARATSTDEDNVNSLNLRTGKYSLRTKIIKNPWVSSRPASKAISWISKTVFANPGTYRYGKNLIYQSGLFMFEYQNPKYKGTSVLPWFDRYPLVLSLGPVVTKEGPRNIGFNLHLLPPKIRIIVLCAVFEMYKKMYRYQVFYKTEKPIQIYYKQIVKALDKYGVRFAIRMYIPARMRQIVRFPILDWHKAIFVPSRGYDSIKAAKLIQEWKRFVSSNGHSTSVNTDWKSKI